MSGRIIPEWLTTAEPQLARILFWNLPPAGGVSITFLSDLLGTHALGTHRKDNVMEPGNEVDTLSILLVQDDRPTALAWVRHFHGVCGFAVYVAFNGFAALKVIAQHPPDIVIVDMGLPYPDGFEVAQRIRALPIGKRPFLIAVTRDQGAEFRRRAEEAGFDLYLVKPVDCRALSQVFRRREGLVESVPAPWLPSN